MNTKNWKLKDVLLIAISAVLFGVVYLGCTYIGGVLYGMLTPFGMASLGYEPFYGIYFMAGAFGIYVMRKPGTGLIAELLAAVLECLYGNYFGPIIILSGLVQGLGFELIIALKRYKKFDRMTMIEGCHLLGPDPDLQPVHQRLQQNCHPRAGHHAGGAHHQRHRL